MSGGQKKKEARAAIMLLVVTSSTPSATATTATRGPTTELGSGTLLTLVLVAQTDLGTGYYNDHGFG